MPVRYKYQTHAECDKCGASTAMMQSKYMFIMIMRGRGWTFGKRVLCPNCALKSRQRERG